MAFESIAEFIKEQQQVPGGSIGLIEALAKYLDEIDDDSRDGFHVSQLYRFSPVQWVLDQILKKPKYIPFRLRFRFDVGHALHGMMQMYLGNMGILKGYWRCRNGHETTEIGLKPDKCQCGDTQMLYKEVRLEHEMPFGHKIVGRTDGIVVWQNEDMGLEIKSVEAEALLGIHKPYDYPIYQLNTYMAMLRQKLMPNIKRGIILFVAASAKESILLPVKAFMIDYSDEPWKRVTGMVESAISLYEKYKRGELTVQELISKRTCLTKADGRKFDCSYVEECFSTAQLSKILSVNSSKV